MIKPIYRSHSFPTKKRRRNPNYFQLVVSVKKKTIKNFNKNELYNPSRASLFFRNGLSARPIIFPRGRAKLRRAIRNSSPRQRSQGANKLPMPLNANAISREQKVRAAKSSGDLGRVKPQAAGRGATNRRRSARSDAAD